MKAKFPGTYTGNDNKKSKDYGYQVATAILDYDKGSGKGGSSYRKQRFHQNKLYAMGKQGTLQYENLVGDTDGDTNFMHLIFKEANPLPPYIRKAKDILTERKFKPRATSMDPISISEKESFKSKMLANLIFKKAQEKLFKGTNINIAPQEKNLPESEEEVLIHAETTLKSSVEMVSEIAANQVFMNNEMEQLQEENANDLLVDKWCGREIFYDENGDMKIEPVSSEEIIVPNSKDSYFKKCRFKARIRQMSIEEIKVMNETEKVYTDTDLEELAKIACDKSGHNWDNAWNIHNYEQPYNSFTLSVLSFEYNTTLDFGWKETKRKEGGYVIAKEDPYAKQPKSERKTIKKKRRQVYFDGLHVINSKKILKWELRKNMPHDGDGLGDSKPYSRFIFVAPEIYNMVNKSIIEEGEYDVDMICSALYKLQQVVSEITPPKIAVDWHAIKNVVIGKGKGGGDSLDAMKVAKQIGVILFDGSKVKNQQFPIQQVMENYGQLLQEIITTINFHYNQLERNIGLNDVIAGNIQNKYEAHQTSELRLNASIKVLSPLQKALKYMNDQTLKVITSMIKQSFIRGDYKQVKGLEKAIGKTNVNILNIAKFDTMNEMGMELEMLPNEREIARIENNIQIDIQNGELGTEDGEMILRMAEISPKYALRLAAIRREKRRKKRMEEAAMNSQMNEQGQLRSNAMAAEKERQNLILKSNLKKQEIDKQGGVDLMLQKNNNMSEMDQIRLKGEYDLEEIEKAKDVGLDQSTSGNSAKSEPRVFPKKVIF